MGRGLAISAYPSVPQILQARRRALLLGAAPYLNGGGQVKGETYIITLCSTCRAAFDNAGGYHIRRVDPNQADKEKCTYCNVRDGYDYKIVPVERKEKR